MCLSQMLNSLFDACRLKARSEIQGLSPRSVGKHPVDGETGSVGDSSFTLGRSLSPCLVEVFPALFAEVGLAYTCPQELEECLVLHCLGGKLAIESYPPSLLLFEGRTHPH